MRLDTALLASVALHLQRSETTVAAALRWPPPEISLLPLKAVHYRAHPMLRGLSPVMSSASHVALCASDYQVLRFLREVAAMSPSSTVTTALRTLDDSAARESSSQQQQMTVVVVPPMPGPDVRLTSGGMGYSWNALLRVREHIRARTIHDRLVFDDT